jgi:hypothetical protein
MFGKLENGNLVIAGNTIKIENGWVTNPSETLLRSLGYKEIVYTEKPEFDKENEKLSEVYTDGENITVSYEKVELSPAEHNAVIKAEIVEEESKITTRNILDFAVDNDQEARNRIQIHRNKIIELRAKLQPEDNIN